MFTYIGLPSTCMLGGLGGFKYNKNKADIINYPIIELNFENLFIDEPCCMQLSYALPLLKNLLKLNMKNSNVGPRGGALILNRIIAVVRPFFLFYRNKNI